MRLTPADISNITSVAEKFISSICASFDRDETDLWCKDCAKGQVCYSKTVEGNSAKDSDVLLVCRRVEILTEYLRLLRNACANCLSNQSVIQR